MHVFSSSELLEVSSPFRRNFLNLISGVRTPFLLGTYHENGVSNLGLFNSVVHIGANPPLLGFVQRPLTVERQSYENLKRAGYYSLNAVSTSIFEKAHQASAKYDTGVSEFDACGFTEKIVDQVNAPFVAESPIRLGMELKEDIPIESNGCRLVVGQIIHLEIDAVVELEEGHFKADDLNLCAVGGLDSYYSLQFLSRQDYARVK